jgi:hypothetical protein
MSFSGDRETDMVCTHAIARNCPSPGLAEVLERVLDKGLVIAGDIRIKLCDVELLTIQIRLLVASVDKARELGVRWWWEPSEEGQPARRLPQARHRPPLCAPAANTPWEHYQHFRRSVEQRQWTDGIAQ